MLVGIVVTLFISLVISVLWVRGIDSQMKYQKENPDSNPTQGWLDWDDNNVTTEGEI
jgi:hypothetical protein